MVEIHTNVYISHNDPHTRQKIFSIFQTLNDQPRPDKEKIESTLKSVSEELLPGTGGQLAQVLIDANNENGCGEQGDLLPERKEIKAGYCVYH